MINSFTPSLIIALGPSGKRAKSLLEELLSSLPLPFKNVIEFYELDDLIGAGKDMQNIIDNKLLSAAYLNELLDMGFKVRSHEKASVKINIFLLWDVYSSNISGYEVIKLLTSLRYGNIDTDLHTGAAIISIAILDRDWEFEEGQRAASFKELENAVNYLSLEPVLPLFDSKCLLLHPVSADGSRVTKKELEYASASMLYLTIVPSESPLLMQYNRRLMKDEGKYKVGTIGISGITCNIKYFISEIEAKLKYDILKYALKERVDNNSILSSTQKLLSFDYQKGAFIQLFEAAEGGNTISDYNRRLNNYINEELIRVIEEDGLKSGFALLGLLEKELSSQVLQEINASQHELVYDEDSGSYDSEQIIERKRFPFSRHLKSIFRSRNVKKHTGYEAVDSSIINEEDMYSREFIEKEIIERAVLDNNEQLLHDINEKKKIIEATIRELKNAICEVCTADKKGIVAGGIVIVLPDSGDIQKLYQDNYTDIKELFRQTLNGVGDLKDFEINKFMELVSKYSKSEAKKFSDLRLAEVLKFKYKENLNTEITKWLRHSLVKAQYLLQYPESEELEQHLLFLSGSDLPLLMQSTLEVECAAQNKLFNCQSEFINSINVVRICYGIDLHKISLIKKHFSNNDVVTG